MITSGLHPLHNNMTFNAVATTNDGIIQTIEELTDLGSAYISGNTTNLINFTARVNRVGHRVWHTIFMSTGNWAYDDGNETDLPQAVTDLTSGTAKYALPPTALTVQRIELKNSAGLWYELSPITTQEIPIAVGEFYKTSGQPTFYRLIGNTIELFAAPSYNSTGGLKVYFDRDSVNFVYTDTTKTPGFASPYHEIIPIMASVEWLKVKQPTSPTLPGLIQDQLRIEKSIKDFYGKRFKNKVPRIGRAYNSFK